MIKSLNDMKLDLRQAKTLSRKSFILACMEVANSYMYREEYIDLKIKELKDNIKLWVKRKKDFAVTHPKPTKEQVKLLYKDELKKSRYQLKGLKYLKLPKNAKTNI